MSRASRSLNVKIAFWILVALVAFVAATSAALAQSGTGVPATQSSNLQGVTVKATLKPPGLSESRWEISIVLDTHSGDIGDDLVQSASLTTADGRTLKPLAWVGAGPGGHHREGVLAFDVPAPRPTSVELRIQRPGEAAPRTFRWQP